MRKMREVFQMGNRATDKAFSRWRNVTEESQDRDVRVYNRLQPADFANLAKTFGPTPVMDYISHMESQRAKEVHHG